MPTTPPSHHVQPAGPDTMPGQLDDIRRRLQRGAERMDRLEGGYRELSVKLTENTRLTKENTEITTQVRDLMTTGRMGTQFIKWAGAMAIAGAAIWSAVYAFLHHGKLPP